MCICTIQLFVFLNIFDIAKEYFLNRFPKQRDEKEKLKIEKAM